MVALGVDGTFTASFLTWGCGASTLGLTAGAALVREVAGAAGLASATGGVSAGLDWGGTVVTGLAVVVVVLEAGTPFTLGTVSVLAGVSTGLLGSTGFCGDGASLTAGFCAAAVSVWEGLGWGVTVVVAGVVMAGLVGEVAAGVAGVVVVVVVVTAGVVVGLAGCAGLAVTVTAGWVVDFEGCAVVCGAEGASLDTGFWVVGTAGGVAAGVVVVDLAGMAVTVAGMAVTVAGMGTAAGTGLAGVAAACVCTGLAWLVVKEV